MPENLFFVDNIYTSVEGNNIVVLLSTEDDKGAVVVPLNDESLKMYNHTGTIREGWYVYYEKERQIPFGYGNLSFYARERFREYYELREQLAARSIDPNREELIIPQAYGIQTAHVTSFHVNVGHGNCSIVLIEAGKIPQIWMVDCSIIDKTDHWRNYQVNLDETIKVISKRIGVKKDKPLHIDRFFLTHAHHDHYSGIEYLVRHHHIDDRTVCYLNLYYQMASKAYIDALTALKNVNVRFVEPVAENSVTGIQFLHPECRLYRSKATVKNTTESYRLVTNPVNDSSAVVMFTLGGRQMVFTGDLEQKGFKNMSGSGTCSSYLFDSDYYVISHHGSLNGHPNMSCKNPRRPMPTPLDCASNRLMKSILMGRNGAYSGIYSPVVTSYWKGTGDGLVLTEDANHYVELDWESGTTTMH